MKQIQLKGLRILNTRAVHQATSLTEKIKQRGGISIEIPLIVIEEPHLLKRNKQLASIHQADWLIFTSVNSFHFIKKALIQQGFSVKQVLHGKKIAAVGTKTETFIREAGFAVEIIPTIFDADHLASSLIEHSIKGERFFYPKSSLSRNVLTDRLRSSGRTVDEMVAYETTLNDQHRHRLNQLLLNDEIDVVIFTSPSAVDSFFKQIDEKHVSFIKNKLTFAVIGRVTEQTLLRYHCKTVMVPEVYTVDSVLTMIEKNRDQI